MGLAGRAARIKLLRTHFLPNHLALRILRLPLVKGLNLEPIMSVASVWSVVMSGGRSNRRSKVEQPVGCKTILPWPFSRIRRKAVNVGVDVRDVGSQLASLPGVGIISTENIIKTTHVSHVNNNNSMRLAASAPYFLHRAHSRLLRESAISGHDFHLCSDVSEPLACCCVAQKYARDASVYRGTSSCSSQSLCVSCQPLCGIARRKMLIIFRLMLFDREIGVTELRLSADKGPVCIVISEDIDVRLHVSLSQAVPCAPKQAQSLQPFFFPVSM